MKSITAKILLTKIKRFLPPHVWRWLAKLKSKTLTHQPGQEFANLMLRLAAEFSQSSGGSKESFERHLSGSIIKGDDQCATIIQGMLTAFLPNYTNDLYTYYREQQYIIFYRFLSYPFKSDIAKQADLYDQAARFLGENLNVLDYGAGIPYPLIYYLQNHKEQVASITLIDLDLVHVNFAEFVIKKIAPEIPLIIIRLKQTDVFPQLSGNYNCLYGKDIFEHLINPLSQLRELMQYSTKKAICFFDFRDHGEKIYQHVSPNINYLSQEMEKIGFVNKGKVQSLNEFVREK